ncbi:MAG: B12-binding domain-containing radical SAM protein [Candidatus Omnitrophica bacterium]|nr:B12-binding domain-containing radical SAM protein [Candidatus Omnitrophota bacterium]
MDKFEKKYRCLKKDGSNIKIKVLLAFPNTGADAKGYSVNPPIPFLYLASCIKDYSVAIYDQRTDPPDVFEKLLKEGPICVGLTCMTGKQIQYALELAEIAKARGIPTVFGGIHPSLLPEQTQADYRVDFVIAGEGEIAFRELLESLEKGESMNPVVYGERMDLNELSTQPYEHLDVEQYVHVHQLPGRHLSYMFSRGCPSACTYCANPALYHQKWRIRNIDDCLNELFSLVEKYNITAVSFFDESLAISPRIFNELIQKIDSKFIWRFQAKIRDLKKHDLGLVYQNGGRFVGCGLESGSPRILKEIKKGQTVEDYILVNKQLAKSGMEVGYNYIMGFPGETMDDLKMTLNLALRMLDENPNAYNNTFYLLSPYPGTEIAQKMISFMPNTLAEWAQFDRHNVNADRYSAEEKELFGRIMFSSKFTGKKLMRTFPDNTELRDLSADMTARWREFSFFDDKDWEQLTNRGLKMLKDLFGENAY